MTADDGAVRPLPRPRGEQLQDRVNLALGILGHRGWCPACLPDAKQVAEALTGVSLEEMARRRAENGATDRGAR